MELFYFTLCGKILMREPHEHQICFFPYKVKRKCGAHVDGDSSILEQQETTIVMRGGDTTQIEFNQLSYYYYTEISKNNKLLQVHLSNFGINN